MWVSEVLGIKGENLSSLFVQDRLNYGAVSFKGKAVDRRVRVEICTMSFEGF
jgi:hypothetical protein